MRPFIEQSQAILKKHDIDVLYSEHNLAWALNHDHSEAYVKAVAEVLQSADQSGGKQAVTDALKRIGKIVSDGKVFRGF